MDIRFMMRCYRKINPTLLHWATSSFQMVLENTQFEFKKQNNWTLALCTEFPLGSGNDIENSTDPSALGYSHRLNYTVYGYSVFSNGLGIYAIWVYVEKYLNIVIWSRDVNEITIRPFSIGLQRFFFKSSTEIYLLSL